MTILFYSNCNCIDCNDVPISVDSETYTVYFRNCECGDGDKFYVEEDVSDDILAKIKEQFFREFPSISATHCICDPQNDPCE